MFLVFFLCVGMLIFYNTAQFKSIEKALIYLISAALGQSDSSIFADPILKTCVCTIESCNKDPPICDSYNIQYNTRYD